ncbi:MAG TPA: NAD(P)-binding domain-containing protein [Solirubrobacteraceae bacterium]|nr:NAD(P)-binding domain-containing protein [Solirubrobacteraceae bacterium]
MTTIGVIGAGHIGRNFSIAAIARGYDIVISNATGPETLGDLIAELGSKAKAATAADAASTGDFALVAIPLTGADALPIEQLTGKIVLTTCNYFPQRDGHFPDIDSGRLTVPGYLQAQIPRSKMVRVFNHLDAADIVKDGTPSGTPNRRALGYAGDDTEAKQLAAGLYEEFGFDAVDVGGLDDAWRLDVDQPTFVVRQNKQQLIDNLARAERHVTAPSQS